MDNRTDLDAFEIDADGLREAEFAQAQAILDTLVGKVIVSAELQETRIEVRTADGNAYFFYGFMGESTGKSD